jgi:hypothetical protein
MTVGGVVSGQRKMSLPTSSVGRITDRNVSNDIQEEGDSSPRNHANYCGLEGLGLQQQSSAPLATPKPAKELAAPIRANVVPAFNPKIPPLLFGAALFGSGGMDDVSSAPGTQTLTDDSLLESVLVSIPSGVLSAPEIFGLVVSKAHPRLSVPITCSSPKASVTVEFGDSSKLPNIPNRTDALVSLKV